MVFGQGTRRELSYYTGSDRPVQGKEFLHRKRKPIIKAADKLFRKSIQTVIILTEQLTCAEHRFPESRINGGKNRHHPMTEAVADIGIREIGAVRHVRNVLLCKVCLDLRAGNSEQRTNQIAPRRRNPGKPGNRTAPQ